MEKDAMQMLEALIAGLMDEYDLSMWEATSLVASNYKSEVDGWCS